LTTIFEDKIAEGAITTGQNGVLTALRKRFTKVPKRIETAIRRIRDPIALESFVGDAVTCKSLNDFVNNP
jgi:hypothetical protein